MINENDFVLINFIGRISQTGKIFDLTYKDVAEKEGVKIEGLKLEPVLVIPRAKYVLPTVSYSVVGKNVGDKYSISIKAKDGFGEFNSKLVKTVSMGVFIENRINPTVGDVVALDDKIATVMSVSGGRVMVNFNHPLAGRDLLYEIEVVDVLKTNEEKCSAIFEHYSGKKATNVNINENRVVITHDGTLQKYIGDAISTDITDYVNKEFKVEFTKS